MTSLQTVKNNQAKIGKILYIYIFMRQMLNINITIIIIIELIFRGDPVEETDLTQFSDYTQLVFHCFDLVGSPQEMFEQNPGKSIGKVNYENLYV